MTDEKDIDRWVAAARAAHPEIRVDEGALRVHLIKVLAMGGQEHRDALLHVADLYLATACLVGDPAALAELTREWIPRVVESVTALMPSGFAGDELGSQVLEAALAPRASGEVELASYSGRGALSKWLRTIAVRILAHERRQHEIEARHGLKAGWSLTTQLGDAELSVLKLQHRAAFSNALELALADLDPRQRNLLRLSLIEGLSIDHIGTMYRIHRATAARWIAAARRCVVESTRQNLSRQLGSSREEVDSLIRLLISQLDVSVRRLLAGQEAT